MADGVPITPGTGVTVAADELTNATTTLTGASQAQYLKIMDGTEGGTSKALVNADGTLAVRATQDQPAATTVSWTSGTGTVNSALTVTTTGHNSVFLSFIPATLTGGQWIFEINDGSGIWQPIQGFRIQAAGSAADNTFAYTYGNVAWQFNVAGSTQFRVRTTTAVTGAGTASFSANVSSAVAPGISMVYANSTFSPGQPFSNANPFAVAFRASTTGAPTAVADLQVVAPLADVYGRLIVVDPGERGRIVSYKGRINSFRIPGRAGTTGQNLLSIHNATGSAVKVRVNKLWLDVLHTAAAGIAPTIVPPVVRLQRVTVLPTNGTAGTKTPMDTTLTSNASVTVLQDASADGTSSGTTLTATLIANSVWSQEFIPRTLVVGTSASTFTELFDRTTFLDSDSDAITLNALEGLVVRLEYTIAAGNPTTDFYVCGLEWEES